MIRIRDDTGKVSSSSLLVLESKMTTVRFRASNSSKVLPSSNAKFWFSFVSNSKRSSLSCNRYWTFWTVSVRNLFSLAIGSCSKMFFRNSFALASFYNFSSKLIISSGVSGTSVRAGVEVAAIALFLALDSSLLSWLFCCAVVDYELVKRLIRGWKAWQRRKETLRSCFKSSMLVLMMCSFWRRRLRSCWFSRLTALSLVVIVARSSCSETDCPAAL